MGTWDHGILDNDTALDGLGDLAGGIVVDVRALASARPGARSTAQLGAAVGLLLQMSAYSFSEGSDAAPDLAAAIRAHEAGLRHLPPRAQAVLRQVLAGQGEQLAERPARLRPETAALLHAGQGARSGFGLREASLFARPAATAYVQQIARRCVAAIQEDFEDEDNWHDLCREGIGAGALAALLVIGPCRVPRSKLERWRRCAQKGLARLEAEADEELSFHRVYYRNLDRVYAALLRRYR